MNTLRPLLRLLLIASLMLGVNVAGLYPHLVAGRAVAGVRKPGSAAKRCCCCGTEGGRCCGMACCQKAAPKRGQAPASPNRSDDRGQPLALQIADVTFGIHHAAALQSAASPRAASIGTSSLVAENVRLNV